MSFKNRLQVVIILLLFLIQNASIGQSETIEVSKNLKIVPLSKHSFIHISYSLIPPYGRVASNGFIYINEGKALVFDTPVEAEETKVLINWLQDVLKVKIEGVVINHFHVDCLGGLEEFHQRGIKSYANKRTKKLAKKDSVPIPQLGFRKKLKLQLGSKEVICRYFGQGHSKDNIIAWIPDEQILFGGCMIKSLKSGKGNLADANIKAWPKTVTKIKLTYPEVKIVIPGHGRHGDSKLLDYTIQMFQ